MALTGQKTGFAEVSLDVRERDLIGIGAAFEWLVAVDEVAQRAIIWLDNLAK
jgi:hypothetical protein